MKKRMLLRVVAWITVSMIPTMTVMAENDVSIHGFVSQGYLKSNANNFMVESDRGSFQFNEMGLNFVYNSDNNVSVGAQLAAVDLGDVGNDTVEVNWAFGDYKWREWMGFRAGIMKLPIGLYNETRDIDSLRTSILLPQSVYDEQTRDGAQGMKGISVYGNVGMGPGGVLQYDFKVTDLQVPLDGGTALNIRRRIGQAPDDIWFDTVYFGMLKWLTPLEGLQVGASGFFTDGRYMINDSDPTDGIDDSWDIQSKDLSWVVYSLEYTFRNLVLAAECAVSDRKIITEFYYPPALQRITNTDDVTSTSYYVSASYRFLDWFEAGLYYSEWIADDDAHGAANELKDYCLSTRFDITDNMVFKLEGHVMDGLYGVQPDDDGSLDDSWMLYAAKVSYMF